MSDSPAESTAPKRVLVAQIGARRHYAVPRMLHQAGMLGSLHTDICATKGWPDLLRRVLPRNFPVAGVRRLMGRVPRGIPRRLIHAETDLGWEFARRLRHCRTGTQNTDTLLWMGEAFCRRVARRGISNVDRVYTYIGDGLEILEEARRRGIPTIVDQTIPAREAVVEMFEQERSAFPDLVGEESVDHSWPARAQREKAEWELADVILCGSEYVRDSIGMVGGPMEKAVVVPTGVESLPQFEDRTSRPNSSTTRVLFVGEVGFRKGAHYLIEAARAMGASVTVRCCGRVVLPGRITGNLPSNVELLGPVPRIDMPRQYAWADMVSFPSLLEGSAAVTYEAMAAGLPLVTTPNAGSLVRDGVDGFIIPPRNVAAIIDGIERVRKGLLPAERTPPTDEPGGPPSYTLEAYRARLVRRVREAGMKANEAGSRRCAP